MEKLSEIVEVVLGEGGVPTLCTYPKARRKLIGELFKLYQISDVDALKDYVRWTQAIPIDKLAIAVAALIRSHQWPRLPLPAEIWEAARCAAGMNREQYSGGHYLKPRLRWPPFGQRHAINLDVGPYEPVKLALAELPESITPELLAEQNPHRGEQDGRNSDTAQE